jgi:ribonuclease R
LKDQPSGKVLNERLLRSMKKAVYSTRNTGHFGLSSDCYTHFTSPIRRYPDLLTHRVLKETLSGRMTAHRRNQLAERLPPVADLATSREITAQQAEWDSIKVKQVRYLEHRLGEVFEGTVVGVRPLGLFVQLDHILVDGLVRVSSLPDDFYVSHERMGAMVGERTGRAFRLGDRIRVEVVRADRRKRQVDFLLADSHAPRRPLPRSPTTRARRRRGP